MAQAKTTAGKADDFGFESFSAFFSLPNMDGTVFSTAITRNMETTMAISRAYFEGGKEIVAKQVDIAKDHMQDMVKYGNDLSTNKLSESAFKASMDAVQTATKRNMQGMRDITDVAVSTHQKAVKVMQERYQQGLEEVQGDPK